MDLTTEQLIHRWKTRDFSWSQISSYEYNPEGWYDRYILHNKSPDTPELLFGRKIGKLMEEGKSIDKKEKVVLPRLSKMEHKFRVKFGSLQMVGYCDSFCTNTNKKLYEFKTGVAKWNKKRVDAHGQLDMYLLMNYITNNIKPEDVDVALFWIPTKRVPRDNGDFSGFDYDIKLVEPVEYKTFKAKRTLTDILNFGARINKTYKDMERFIIEKNTLS